jgi:hypothetical protein
MRPFDKVSCTRPSATRCIATIPWRWPLISEP